VLPTAPAIRDAGRREAIYRALLDHAREGGFERLSIGHSWGDTFEDLPFLAGHVSDQVTDFVIDIRPSLEDLMGGMHKVHRKNIRRAERAGLTVTVDHRLEALLELRRFQQISAERARTRGNGFSVRDSGYFRSIQEAVYGPGLGEVHVAHLEGTCVGAMAYLASGSRGVTVRSGCDARGYETYAMYLLQLSVIESARQKGVTELNIGGVPREAEEEGHPQHGLHAFKKGFGGTAHLRQAVSLATAEARRP
jgi:lipid II:glycine glycyltransferase (peptidoglycan interpeptide bridge formation enzyme)